MTEKLTATEAERKVMSMLNSQLPSPFSLEWLTENELKRLKAENWRTEQQYEGTQSLIDSMLEVGQIDAILVYIDASEVPHVLWGNLRTVSAKALGWLSILARVLRSKEMDGLDTPELIDSIRSDFGRQRGAGWGGVYLRFESLWNGPLGAQYRGKKEATMRRIWGILCSTLPSSKVDELNLLPEWGARMGRMSTPYNELRYVYELKKADPFIGAWAQASMGEAKVMPNGRDGKPYPRALQGQEVKRFYSALMDDNAHGAMLGKGTELASVLESIIDPVKAEAAKVAASAFKHPSDQDATELLITSGLGVANNPGAPILKLAAMYCLGIITALELNTALEHASAESVNALYVEKTIDREVLKAARDTERKRLNILAATELGESLTPTPAPVQGTAGESKKGGKHK